MQGTSPLKLLVNELHCCGVVVLLSAWAPSVDVWILRSIPTAQPLYLAGPGGYNEYSWNKTPEQQSAVSTNTSGPLKKRRCSVLNKYIYNTKTWMSLSYCHINIHPLNIPKSQYISKSLKMLNARSLLLIFFLFIVGGFFTFCSVL